jgi:phospholipid transport system substrate-binding protein
MIMSMFIISTPLYAAPVDDASRYIESVASKAVEVISNKNLDKEAKSKKIEQLFRDSVDIDWVGKFVVGHYWRQASETQKKNYLKEYQGFLTRQYANRFAEYTDGSFKITGAHDDGDGEYTVNMKIKGNAGDDTQVIVDYKVRSDKGNFKIFDVTIEGVSMITTQRSEFNSVISNKGMDYLITQLANKAETMANSPAKP